MDLIIEGQEWLRAREPERVTINSDDGLDLVAFYLPAEGGKRTMLMMHGYRSPGDNDFACVQSFYHELGFNLLIAHQRGHGESGGKHICFGVKERWDVLRWVEYINQKTPDQDIFLSGISMGATTVLMALGLYLPANVRGCVADCGFTSPWDEFVHVMKVRYHLPARPFIDALSLYAKSVLGFDFRVSTKDALKRAAVPVLFIHGGKDKFVPCWMSEANFEACASEKQIVIVPEAGHGASYLVETERCQRILAEFLERHSTQ